ncbi:MAG: phytoene desaturase family protein [Desulfotomaculales bacterium]
MAKKYDTVVIGSGIGGMGVAAMLAKDFKMKVLVLEKAPYIGGRVASFVGKGNRVVIDGLELDADGFKYALELAKCWIGYCQPDIETMFKKGLLDGWTFEAGGHGLFWGNKGRVRFLLDHLGKPVDIPVNTGFAFVDFERGNKAYQVGKGQPYQWMSPEGYAMTLKALRDMGRMDLAEAAAQMNISLQEWLDKRGFHPEAYDYIKVLASSQTAQAEPAMTPAGDFLGYMAIQRDIKMNLVTGSVGTVANPGCIAIPLAMEECLVENGGEVLRNTPVDQVIIEGGRAKGVIVRTKSGTETIYADAVVCNIPPKNIFSVLHRRHFPADWVKTIETEFWSPGLLSGLVGLKRDVWAEKGIDERSFIYMPGVIRHEGYIGCVDIVMWNMVSSARGSVSKPGLADKAGRGPDGMRDFVFSVALTDAEMRNPQKVKRCIEWCETWARRTFPTWEEDVLFSLWTPSDEAYGHWRPVGKERPDVKCPWVEGLYFVGDQYGKRMWGGGVDGASLCAVMCVDAIMGTNYEDQIFPPYHRGTPQVPVHW